MTEGLEGFSGVKIYRGCAIVYACGASIIVMALVPVKIVVAIGGRFASSYGKREPISIRYPDEVPSVSMSGCCISRS